MSGLHAHSPRVRGVRSRVRSTAATKGIFSDAFAQTALEKRPLASLDTMRTAAFAAFGALYLGLFAQYKYAFLYPSLFGHALTVGSVAAKVSADMLISAPFVYFPLYFMSKGLFAGKGPLKSLREFFSGAGMDLLRARHASSPRLPTRLPRSCRAMPTRRAPS